MSSNERFKKVIDSIGDRQLDIAKSLQVSQRTISYAITNGRKRDLLTGLAEHYPNLNFHWLLLGKGEMWKYEDKTSDSSIMSRVKEFLTHKNLKIEDFAQKHNIPINISSDKVNQGTDKNLIRFLLKEYPKLNLKWLILGEGAMTVENMTYINQDNRDSNGLVNDKVNIGATVNTKNNAESISQEIVKAKDEEIKRLTELLKSTEQNKLQEIQRLQESKALEIQTIKEAKEAEIKRLEQMLAMKDEMLAMKDEMIKSIKKE